MPGAVIESAATALKTVIEQQATDSRGWEITLVNLQEVLHSLDIFEKITGIRLEDIYNLMLAKGWTLGSAQGLRFMHGVIRTVPWRKRYVYSNVLGRHQAGPGGFAGAEFQSRDVRKPREGSAAHAVRYDSDRFRRLSAAFLDGAAGAIFHLRDRKSGGAGARDWATTNAHVFRTSGMILRPRFYEPVDVDRAAERKRLGLDPERPTGLVLFGGQGSKVMLEIARAAVATRSSS